MVESGVGHHPGDQLDHWHQCCWFSALSPCFFISFHIYVHWFSGYKADDWLWKLVFFSIWQKKCWRSSLRRPTYSLASVVNPDPLFLQWILSKIYSFNVLRLEMKMIAKVSPVRLSGGRKWCRSRLRRPTYSLVAPCPVRHLASIWQHHINILCRGIWKSIKSQFASSISSYSPRYSKEHQIGS